MTKQGSLYRKTNHAKPKFQLYQPGFNARNGCWLDGDWITLSQTEWESRKDQHDSEIREAQKRPQHHSDGPVLELSNCEKQAWEFYGGQAYLAVFKVSENAYNYFSVRLAGPGLAKDSEAWIRSLDCVRVPRFIQENEETVDQTKNIQVPPDLIFENTPEQAVNIWKEIVLRNASIEEETYMTDRSSIFDGCLERQKELCRDLLEAEQNNQPDKYMTFADENARLNRMLAKKK